MASIFKREPSKAWRLIGVRTCGVEDQQGAGIPPPPKLVIDTEARTVSHEGRALKIDNGERFRVLQELVRGDGELVPFAKLRPPVKPETDRSKSRSETAKALRNLQSRILRINTALKSAGYPATIECIRGKGYRLP